MTEKKQCPFDGKLACENCRLFISIAGNVKQCVLITAAYKLFSLDIKGTSGNVPFYSSQR